MSMVRTLRNDSRVLWKLLSAGSRGSTHEDRLRHFYSGQADAYDSFRKKLLHGRQEMIDRLPVAQGDVWVDVGCGTGENLERFGARLPSFSEIHLVDLCEPLLDRAKQRIKQIDQPKITCHHTDATKFDLPSESVDLVTFSYSLTMIPDWFLALQNALRMLKPNGAIGVVDFFVGRKFPAADEVKHPWTTRVGWSTWFAFDNVFLTPDHLAMLRSMFLTESLEQHRGTIAYMPFFKAPYYIFLGKKRLRCSD